MERDLVQSSIVELHHHSNRVLSLEEHSIKSIELLLADMARMRLVLHLNSSTGCMG
jgi:hypothetical protein